MSVIVPIILCGGSGSRLWPVSRETYPKQLVCFNGGGRSLFQDTLARVTGQAFGRPIVVTGNDYRFLIAEQVHDLGLEADILLEPMRRDSCAAIAAAAAHAGAGDEDAILLVVAADHAIPDTEGFLGSVATGVPAAAAGHIVTFGIRPTAPATGYGYIRPGEALDGLDGVYRVGAFVEKPDAETAERYLAEGYLWNSGNFLFGAAGFLEELDRLAPEIGGPARESVRGAVRDLDFLRLDPHAFGRAAARSVDYAVMEKTARAAVVPADFAWSDVGSWSAVSDLAARDDHGNAAFGDGVFHAASGCYVYSPSTLSAVVGLEDVIVVATRDAVLVAHRDRAEEVKALVGRLVAEGRGQAIAHPRVYQPWGDHEEIDRGHRYQVRRLTVKPGARLSLQSHVHRAEHWVVVSGTARVTIGEEVRIVAENESVYVPLGAAHRLENPGRIPLELIEVRSGGYLGEDDVVRYDEAGE